MDAIAWLILAWILRNVAPNVAPAPRAPKGPPPKFPSPQPIPIPVPQPGQPAPAPAPATATSYVVQSGDTGFGLAQRYAHQGSRWRELLSANPQLSTVTKDGATQITPWNVGDVITWPLGWDAPQAGGSPGSTGPRAQRAPTPSPGAQWTDPDLERRRRQSQGT